MTMAALMSELRQLTERVVERRSGVAMRGKQQKNYLQRLIDLGDNLGTGANALTMADVLADRANVLAKLWGENAALAAK
jgi:hypothetical protein